VGPVGPVGPALGMFTVAESAEADPPELVTFSVTISA
jgi:hypothetical protein